MPPSEKIGTSTSNTRTAQARSSTFKSSKNFKKPSKDGSALKNRGLKHGSKKDLPQRSKGTSATWHVSKNPFLKSFARKTESQAPHQKSDEKRRSAEDQKSKKPWDRDKGNADKRRSDDRRPQKPWDRDKEGGDRRRSDDRRPSKPWDRDKGNADKRRSDDRRPSKPWGRDKEGGDRRRSDDRRPSKPWGRAKGHAESNSLDDQRPRKPFNPKERPLQTEHRKTFKPQKPLLPKKATRLHQERTPDAQSTTQTEFRQQKTEPIKEKQGVKQERSNFKQEKRGLKQEKPRFKQQQKEVKNEKKNLTQGQKEFKQGRIAKKAPKKEAALPQNPRSGVVALMGLPNAGKSTLLNALLNQPLAITSAKSGTTRFPLKGVGRSHDSQLVLIDTPGLFESATSPLEKAMLHAAENAPFEADIWLLVVDVTRGKAQLEHILSHFPELKRPPLWVVLNKIDAVSKTSLLAWADTYKNKVERLFMVSALKTDGTDDLWRALGEAMPERAWLFDPDVMTTLPTRLFVAEVTREVLLEKLSHEIPHHLYVETEQLEERPRSLKIHQVIHVTNPSQKPIILGAKGTMIHTVGVDARGRMMARLGKKIHLFLHVRVTPKWQQQTEFYHLLGLEQGKEVRPLRVTSGKKPLKPEEKPLKPEEKNL